MMPYSYILRSAVGAWSVYSAPKGLCRCRLFFLSTNIQSHKHLLIRKAHKTATLLYCREAMFGARSIRESTSFFHDNGVEKDPIGFADGEPHFEVARGDREGKCFAFWKIKRRFAIRINLRGGAAAKRSHDNGASQSVLTFGAEQQRSAPTITALRIKRRPCFIVARRFLVRAPFGKPPPFCLSPTGKKTPPRRGNNDNDASHFGN